MADNLKPPSEKTVRFLYDGVLAFYPDVAKDVFALGKITLPYHESWGGFRRLDFLEFALNTTDTDSIDEAARTVKDWREGKRVEKTVPERLDEMVAKLEEEQAKMAAYEKQKLAKEALLESQRAKEAVPEAKEERAPSQEVSAPAEGEPPPPAEAVSVGIQITPQAGRVFQKVANRVASAPVRAAVAFAAPTIAAQGQGIAASALILWTRGIKSGQLEKEASKLKVKEAKDFNELVKSLKNIEAGHSLQTRIIQRAYPVKYVSLLLKAGVPQSRVDVFFNPPEAGGTVAVPRRSFLGNLLVGVGQQVFGGVASKAVSGLVSKAAGAATTKAIGAGVGTAVGGPVGTAIGYVSGWIANKVVGKVLDFLREHRGVVYALLFLPVVGAGLFFGIPFLTFAGGLGIAVSLTGGTGAAVAGLGGTLQGLFGTLGSIFVTSIATPVVVALVSIPVVVALILFIINSGAYVVPPRPLGTAFEGPPINCSDEKGPIGVAGPSSSSPIATRAWKITYDLYQGFWCSWNRSPGNPPHPDFLNDVLTYPPGYPELFDYGLFRTNPNPATRYDVRNLFWCTWLPIKAYRENGNPIGAKIYSPDMYNDFKGRGKIINRGQTSPSNVKAGAVVFFDVDNSENRIDHVGVVFSVNQDGVTFVQSNAPTKDDFIPFGSNGLQDLPGITVIAIGNP